MEIVVIDNGSENLDGIEIESRVPQVHWIPMAYNAGFARASNEGMRRARADVYLLLNPDTLAVDDSIEKCYHRLVASEYLAAGVQLLNEAGEPQISGSHFVKGGLNHLLPIPYWGGFIRWLGYASGSRVPGVRQAAAVQEVDWISGAFLMVKKEAVEKAGLMDEDFFLFGEEVEWCSRLRKFGKLCIFGDLKIVHLEGGSINKEQDVPEKGYYNLFDKKGLQLMVSNHLRVRKQYGVFWFLFLLSNYSWGWFFYAFCGTVHRIFTWRDPRPEWKKMFLFGGNLLRLWALVPKILSGRPHFYKMF